MLYNENNSNLIEISTEMISYKFRSINIFSQCDIEIILKTQEVESKELNS